MSDDRQSPPGSSRQLPRAISIDDVETETAVAEEPHFAPRGYPEDHPDAAANSAPEVPNVAPRERSRSLGWFKLLVAAIAGLLLMSFSLWTANLVSGVLARQDWIGWTGLILLCFAGLAALMLLGSEILALTRLARLNRMRERAAAAIDTADDAKAAAASAEIVALYADRPDLDWARARMSPQPPGTAGLAVLRATESTLLTAIDREAVRLVEQSSERVAAVTVLSPFLIFDVFAIIAINLRLLRRIAGLYGGRPGLLGALRLGRLAVLQIFADAGFELAGDFLPATVARGAGFFGRKVGEGMVNGFMTARIGCNAIDLCRPMPFDAVKRPNPMRIFGRISRRYAGAAGRAAFDAGRDAVGRAASNVVTAVTRGRADPAPRDPGDKS